MQSERTQVGARLRDRHRELVGTDVAVLLSFEEEHTALFEIGGEQVEPTDQQRDRRLVVCRHQLLAEGTQERTFCREDRLQFLRELTAKREPEKPLSDRVLLPQDTLCTQECVTGQCEPPLLLVQEREILLPEERAAVHLHARGADVTLRCTRPRR